MDSVFLEGYARVSTETLAKRVPALAHGNL